MQSTGVKMDKREQIREGIKDIITDTHHGDFIFGMGLDEVTDAILQFLHSQGVGIKGHNCGNAYRDNKWQGMFTIEPLIKE